MGCDYYVLQKLYIYYNAIDYLYIVLERINGYYYHYLQDNEYKEYKTYEETLNEYTKNKLTPKTHPEKIYENNQFLNSYLETKYKKLVEKTIHEYNKSWEDIVKIIKVEERMERK